MQKCIRRLPQLESTSAPAQTVCLSGSHRQELIASQIDQSDFDGPEADASLPATHRIDRRVACPPPECKRYRSQGKVLVVFVEPPGEHMMWSLALCATLMAQPNEPIRLEQVLLTVIESADIPAQEAGVLVQTHLREGAQVEPGALLGVLRDDEARLAVARAETEVRGARETARNRLKLLLAEKSSEVAKAEYRRAAESAEKVPKSVSATELDRLRLVAERSDLEIEQAQAELVLAEVALELKQHDLDAARMRLARRQVTAPIGGVVMAWKRQRGEWVEPGTPLVHVVLLQRLRVEGFLPAGRLDEIQVGAEAVFLPANTKGGRRFIGQVTFVSPEIDPVTAQGRIWVEIENSNLALRPGQRGELQIQANPPTMTTAPATKSDAPPLDQKRTP